MFPNVACKTNADGIVAAIQRWFGMAALVIVGGFMFGGCATPPRLASAPDEKGQTFGESKGVQAGLARTTETLSVSQSARKERIAWGGVSLFQIADRTNAMPISSALLKDLQESLVQSLSQAKFQNFELVGLGKGIADNWSEALVMSVVLSYERIYSYPSLGKNKVHAEVSGEILFVDTKAQMQVTASYPIGSVIYDFVDGALDQEKIYFLVKQALIGKRKLADGKSTSLEGQVIQQLEGGAIAPRALRAPIAIESIEFAPKFSNALVLGKPFDLLEGQLVDWRDSWARTFCGFLAYGTGFPVNPYVGIGGKITSEQSISRAAQMTMRRVDGQMQTLTIRKPVFNLVLKLDSLNADIAKDVQGTPRLTEEYGLVNLSYGFTGRLVAVNADTGKEIINIPLVVPGDRKSVGNSKLADKYLTVVSIPIRVKSLDENAIDHSANWSGRMKSFLEQLAHEIAFPEEDLAKRYGVLRNSIQRNALLINQIDDRYLAIR